MLCILWFIECIIIVAYIYAYVLFKFIKILE